MQTEKGVHISFDFVQLAFENGFDHSPGIFDFYPVPDPIGSFCPPGIHQPAGYVIFGNLLPKHICINGWVQGHERGTKTGAENRCRFTAHAFFGSCYFSGVA